MIANRVMTLYRFLQDCGHSVANLLRFMVWPRLTFKKVQAIGIRHTKFRPGTCIHMYINPRPRYYYFRFLKTNGRHIEILLPVLSLTLSLSSACDFPSTHQISSKSDHPRQSYDVIAIFKMAAVSMLHLV